MDNHSKYKSFDHFISSLQEQLPAKYAKIFGEFLEIYVNILKEKNLDLDFYLQRMSEYAQEVITSFDNPKTFEPFHVAERSPYNYYQMGIDIFKPTIDLDKSTLSGKENLESMIDHLTLDENIILFANHQIEADPQAISIMLEKSFPHFAENIIFIAGERVVTDPMAIPFSRGSNLLCIYSKKYFDSHAERKSEMQHHNRQAMLKLGNVLNEGNKCVIIFPSGGRDRRDDSGNLSPAPFDPQSIELMHILGKKAKARTLFFPLALSTHDILPPPDDIQVDLGEPRPTKEAPIHLFFGKEIDMENFPGSDTKDKKERRMLRAHYVWDLVCELYKTFPN